MPKGLSKKNKKSNPKNSNGYVWVYRPGHPHAMSNGYVYKHRIVMERHLGRYLDDDEQVIHRDGNKSNNKIKNLILMREESDGSLTPESMKKAAYLRTNVRLASSEISGGDVFFIVKVALKIER